MLIHSIEQDILQFLNEEEIAGLTAEDLDRPFAELEEKITADATTIRAVLGVPENSQWRGVLEKLFDYELKFHASFSKWKEEEVPLHEITPRKMLIQNDMDRRSCGSSHTKGQSGKVCDRKIDDLARSR